MILQAIRSTAPRIRSTAPRMRSTAPRIRSTAPRMRSTAPRIRSTAPRMRSTAPRMRSTAPRMRSLPVLLPVWFLVFCNVSANVPAAYPAELIFSIDIGPCTVDFNINYLIWFQKCLCSDAQTCQVKTRHRYLYGKNQPIKIRGSGVKTRQTGSSTAHYICDVNCKRGLISNQVDLFVCNYVQTNEYESQCTDGLHCNSSVRMGFTESANCGSCVDIRWRSSDRITVLIRNNNRVQYGQCPRESLTTKGTTTEEVPPDVSLKPPNGSEVLGNGTTLTGEMTEVSIDDSGLEWVRIIIPISLTVLVFSVAVFSIRIIFRQRSKAGRAQHSGNVYITPVDVVYSSSELLAHRQAAGNSLALNGCFQLSAMERNSNIYSATENEYSDVSFPVSCGQIHVSEASCTSKGSCNQESVDKTSGTHTDACCLGSPVNEYAEAGHCSQTPVNKTLQTQKGSCDQISVNQTEGRYTGACKLGPSVSEYAESNIYTDLAKTANTNEDSNKPHYTNVRGPYPNDASDIGSTKTVKDVPCSKVDPPQAVTSEANYSTINDCDVKHCSSKCEASFACSDTAGAYKIMTPVTANFCKKTKTRHTSDRCTKLDNSNKMYTRLREHPEEVTNVYDVLVTEIDDLIFKPDILYSSIDPIDEPPFFSLCPLQEQRCLEEDLLNGNLYENSDNSPLNAPGSNSEVVCGTTKLFRNNCAEDEDKMVEPDSTYVNYTDRGNHSAASTSAYLLTDKVTYSNLSANDQSSVTRSCFKNNGDQSCLSNAEKENNHYVEMMPQI